MPVSKEIELRLKARLEAGDAHAQAESVGMQIAQGIEKSFENLGERLVRKMLDQFKTGFSNFNWSNVSVGGGGFQPSQGYNVQSGFYGGANGGNPGTVTFKPHIPGQASADSNIATEGLSSARGSQTDPRVPPSPNAGQQRNDYSQSGAGPQSGPQGQTGRTSYYDLFGRPRNEQSSNEEKLNALMVRVQAHQHLRKLDPESAGDPTYTQSDIKEAKSLQKALAQDSRETVDRLSKALERLTGTIDEDRKVRDDLRRKSESGQELSSGEKDTLRRIEDKDRLIDSFHGRIQVEQRKLNDREKADKVFSEETPQAGTPWYKSARNLSLMGAVAGAVIPMAADWKSVGRAGAAGEADLSRFGTRDIMDKNYAGMIATSQLGGEERMDSEAGFSTKLKAYGKIGLGALGAGISAVAGATGIGLPAAAIGGTLSATGIYSGVSDLRQADKLKAEYMRQQQSMKMFENKEFMQMFGESYGLAKGAFQESLGYGSDTYESTLYGGGVNGVLDRSKYSGLTREQLLMNQRTAASSMGSVFNGKNTLGLSGVQDAMVGANQLAGVGFHNSHSIAGAFYRGGTQRRNGPFGDTDPELDVVGAYGRSNRLYKDLYGADGMQQDYVPQMLDNMAAIGGRLPGAMDAAVYNTQAVVSASQRAGGRENSAYLQVREQVQNSMSRGSNTGAGAMGMAKAMTVDEFDAELKRRTGKGLSKTEKMAVTLGDNSAGFAEKLLKDRNFQGDSGDAGAEMFEKYQKSLLGNVARVGGVAAGDEELAGVLHSKRLGIDSAESLMTGANQYKYGRDNVFKTTGQGPTATGSHGRKGTEIDTAIDVTKTAEGFKTLGDTISVLNSSMPQFLNNMSKLANIMIGNESKVPGRTTPNPVPNATPKSE